MDRMLEAAMCAPSANNRQLWHFVVIRDREMLRKVAEVHPYAKMAAGAAAAVIICADLNEEKTPGFWVQDCSAATQNFMLAARALNIGNGLVRSASHRGTGPARSARSSTCRRTSVP